METTETRTTWYVINETEPIRFELAWESCITDELHERSVWRLTSVKPHVRNMRGRNSAATAYLTALKDLFWTLYENTGFREDVESTLEETG